MRALVTGCAGFIGSHLTEALLARGHDVTGVDCLTDYYDVAVKRRNLTGARQHAGFSFVEADLEEADLAALLDGADVVFHLAGQPGVRLSWSAGFGAYVSRNVVVTQRLLEAAMRTPPQRIVFSSSSSVYGNAASYPTTESTLPAPHSPYGVTKLAAEQMCNLYAANWGLSTVSLRYFTVYGPRQRPDMGLHKFIEATRAGAPVTVYGDGKQIRDFTFVADVVNANLAAAQADVAPGTVVNIAGGRPVTVNELLATLGEALGREVEITRLVQERERPARRWTPGRPFA